MTNLATESGDAEIGSTAKLHRFMDIELELAPDVLIPRQETELLGRRATDILLSSPNPHPKVIDLCCGSGNLALAIASLVPTARMWASDYTEHCVALAKRNADRLGLADRITVMQGDMFSALAEEGLLGCVDMIVCNPPYISTSRLEGESAHLLEEEPREAFDGGPYGISIHQRLLTDAIPFLKPDGWLLFEFGEGQDRQIKALVARARRYAPVSFACDGGGRPRVAITRMLNRSSDVQG
ncbi:MAG: methyltransferase [Ahrensia sp.]|nr:methyltransferase [Ahrensia sp.]|tara:strand:+ start:48933 stop:49652 length:720 start_codon:yes stop_codon:yes gene_type:complete